jgi:Putative aminopeptidase
VGVPADGGAAGDCGRHRLANQSDCDVLKPAVLRTIPTGLFLLLAAVPCAIPQPGDARETIQAIKAAEQAAGIKPSGNFARLDPAVTAYYRCYYTGKLELPQSYGQLKLKDGTKEGCPLDEDKYDVFFYPIEAVSTGHVPVTQALAAASVERLATVVPHEDFHLQVTDLPDRVAEAATTLVGFLAGAAAAETLGNTRLRDEAEIFLRKAVMLNRYFERLSALYKSARAGAISKAGALDQKGQIMTALLGECRSLQPEPRSFNRCAPVANNAGIAFDYTYTRDYPALYLVYRACRQDLRCTIAAMESAPRHRPEAEVLRYLEAFARNAVTADVPPALPKDRIESRP